jgi:hypothetical protein
VACSEQFNRFLRGPGEELRFDLQEFNPEASCEGEFFAGLDLAQTRDYCVLRWLSA